jgi:hypothetical protein
MKILILTISFLSLVATAAPKDETELRHDRKAAGTNVIRLVDGKAYNVLLSTNWVTIPGFLDSGTFLENTVDGPAFSIKKYLRGGGWETQTIVVRNSPYRFTVNGQAMPPMRLLPVGTSKHFLVACPIYDWGKIPKPATNSIAASTNAPPEKVK